MKILGICGSPKGKKSTTRFGLEKALAAAAAVGVETQMLAIRDYQFSGCCDCGACYKELKCAQADDFSERLLPLLSDPDIKGMIYASPVYFGGVTAQMKAFMDRCVPFRRNGYLFEDRISGVLTVGRSRHGGQELTAMDLIKNCLIHGMTVVPDRSPTSHFGGMLWSGHPDGIEKDEKGIETAENLGKRVAEITLKIHG